mgnify:CR=1 FL=1
MAQAIYANGGFRCLSTSAVRCAPLSHVAGAQSMLVNVGRYESSNFNAGVKHEKNEHAAMQPVEFTGKSGKFLRLPDRE